MSKKIKKVKSVLEAVDRSERAYNSSTGDLTGVYLKQPKSADKIVEFSSLEELSKLYNSKGESDEKE
jgi:hypothetical protein|nr:MAG TPA: hypothetical protein [Caudoviricetes sp.]